MPLWFWTTSRATTTIQALGERRSRRALSAMTTLTIGLATTQTGPQGFASDLRTTEPRASPVPTCVASRSIEATHRLRARILNNSDLQFHTVCHAEKQVPRVRQDRKSTRLNSSHANISYAVFCL